MSVDKKRLIADFRSLPDAAKREVLAELLRISRDTGASDQVIPLTDDTLELMSDIAIAMAQIKSGQVVSHRKAKAELRRGFRP